MHQIASILSNSFTLSYLNYITMISLRIIYLDLSISKALLYCRNVSCEHSHFKEGQSVSIIYSSSPTKRDAMS